LEAQHNVDPVTDILNEHRQKLLAYVLHLVGDINEAEDILQELQVILLQSPQMLTRAGDVFAYLRGTARHLAAGRHRLKSREGEVLRRWTEWAWEADSEPDEAAEIARTEQLEALRKCREQLPENTGKILGMRYETGLDPRSIAERIGANVTAIKVALFRARRSLAECIRRRLAEETAS